MKQTLLFIFLMAQTWLFAQKDAVINTLTSTPIIDIPEQQVDFRKEVKPALVAGIVSDEDAYAKDWKTFMQTRYGVESKKGTGFMEAKMVLIPAWFNDSINVYHRIDKDGDFIRMTLLVENRGTFFSAATHPDAVMAIRSALALQIKEFYIKYYDGIIEDQQKEYERQTKDHEKLLAAGARLTKELEHTKKEITNSENSIRDYKNDISTNEGKAKSLESKRDLYKQELERMKKELESTNAQIVTKQKDYDKLNTTGDLDTKKAEKVMKELEKLRSTEEKQLKEVSSMNEDIGDTEKDILSCGEDNNKLQTRIHEQENTMEKNKGKVKDLERDIASNISETATKATMVEAAREKTERLKTAKAGIMAQ